MTKFVVVIETNTSWSAPDIKDNIEENFPGWQVQVLSFIPEGKEQDLLSAIVQLQEEGRARLKRSFYDRTHNLHLSHFNLDRRHPSAESNHRKATRGD